MPSNLAILAHAALYFFCLSAYGADLTLAPSANFGTGYLNSTNSLTLTLTNTSSPGKVISNINASVPALNEPFGYVGGSFPGTAGTCLGGTVNAGASCTLVIRFLPTAIGSYSGTLALTYKLQNAPKSISFSVSGTGALSPAALSLSPTSHHFLTRPVQSTAQVTFTLSNTGQTAASNLANAPALSGAYSITGGTCTLGGSLAAAGTCTVSVSFAPTSAQEYTASFSMGATGVSAATASLTGVGISPQSSGTFDSSFGSNGNGSSTSDSGSTSEFLIGLTPNGDNSLFGGGFASSPTTYTNEFVVSKYNANGVLDSAFNGTGIKTISFSGNHSLVSSVLPVTGGGVMLTGHSSNDFAVAQVSSTGVLDASFASTGQAKYDLDERSDDFCYSSLRQSDGKTVLVGTSSRDGSYRLAIVRLTASGAYDLTFNSTGKVIEQIGSGNTMAFASALQSDGKIMIAGIGHSGTGFDFLVARFTSSGVLDTGFNGTGYRFIDFGNTADLATGIKILSNGKYAVTGRVRWGSSNFGVGVARINSDGTIDTSFGSSGKYTSSFETGSESRASIQESVTGELYLAWYVTPDSDPAPIRVTSLQSNGALRSTFGTNGTLVTSLKIPRGQIPPLLIDSSGRLTLGGASLADLAMQRLW